ncbi:endonuclease/exonuclease/phosphatase family protein [Bradyrhizobium sp. CB3481]|uniref:endonuclease/exonuclease/phosphatase family protein n=1 Tax=Bradyrhizobium sp. CB3481 TaxID=3039158 RepID=UPI0024B1AE45|nr:endonuclease/exonuclease/phosphatase family protein [Bradyrhizobium sp. CB3481]WFU13868.1 endonuclease/exonuclease/phosphatase family protein [Bradyrhizobium sp. CB3481]
MRLRIVTLNVWNRQGDPRRAGLINRELCKLAPDLVSFQEVVQSPERSQLDELIHDTGLHGTHQAGILRSAPPYADRFGGNAVATRWPHHVEEVLDLRMSDANDIPWCSLAVTVPLPGAGDVLFIATTTSWRLSAEAARERQAVALTDLDARHRRTLPTIIAGDFNATPDAASIRYLRGLQSLGGRSVRYHDAWEIAGEGQGHTWSVDNPNAKAEIGAIVRQPHHRRRVDYVFVGSWDAHPKAICEVAAASLAFDRPVDGIWLSDHFGVVVDVEIRAIS